MIRKRLINGSTIINGLDISELGIFMIQNGGQELLIFPERIEPKSHNWYEYSGLDVDLSDIHFHEREVEIEFCIYAKNAPAYEYNLNELYRIISHNYISLYSREYHRTFELRYISVNNYTHTGGLYKDDDKVGTFKVQFALDDPLQLFRDPSIIYPRKFGSLLSTESALLTTDTGLYIDLGDAMAVNSHLTHVSLNGIDLGAFGIIVNECYNSMLKLSAVKKPLTRRFEHRNGLLAYPSQRPTFEAKELVINCTMRADSRAEFYWNYEALFNNLSKTGALQVDSYLGSAQCYYSKMENFKKLSLFSQRVLVSFTLRLVQVNPSITSFVLGTANDTAILTDNSEYILYQN